MKGEKMEETKRPGLLTALAVISFIVAFLYIVVNGLGFLSFVLIDYVPLESLSEAQISGIEAMRQLSTGDLALRIGPPLIAGILLLLAGIGYLKQKKILGWVMGNAYAAVIILHTVIPLILTPASRGGAFSLTINLAYPVITLILINFVYKKNLVN